MKTLVTVIVRVEKVAANGQHTPVWERSVTAADELPAQLELTALFNVAHSLLHPPPRLPEHHHD